MKKYQNAYLFEVSQTVKSIESKDNSLIAEFDDTIFYPGGGGQPSDKGIIKNGSFEGEVVEAYKKDDKVFHKVKPIYGELHPGDKITLSIDKDRRIKLVKMHTGEHILFKSLQNILGEITLDKIDLSETESSLFIFAKELTWDKLFEAERQANKIIEENRQITEKEYPKEDAVVIEKLRIKPDRIRETHVRVIEISDFDLSACTGTHADNTGYAGNILITKFSFVKGSYEIRFKTDVKEDFFELARIARLAASELKADTQSVVDSIKRLQDESENYKTKFRQLSFRFLDNFKRETVGEITFITNIVEEIEKKQLMDKAAELAKEKTIVCFANISEGKATILLSISPDLNIDAPQLLTKVLNKYNGKGGGRGNFAMGSVEEKHAIDMIQGIKDIIK